MAKKNVIFGYGYEGVQLYKKLLYSDRYEVISFADNSMYKKGNIVDADTIKTVDELAELKDKIDFSVIIAARKWYEIGEQLEEHNIPIEGVYQDGVLTEYQRMSFEKLDLKKEITLYAGDICDDVHISDPNLYGVSINKADSRHILHDITHNYPLPDNCIFSYQAEDVLEHIDKEKIVDTINEVYRILKPNGVFRVCLPDYFSPYLKKIVMRDKNGNILFDATGGGEYGEGGVMNGGHVWFPNYINMKEILGKTKFSKVDFLCYHTEDEKLVKKNIDYSKGYVKRIPTEMEAGQPIYSLVVDCLK